MLYMVTFTINIPPMLAYIPYMDPMGLRKKTVCATQFQCFQVLRFILFDLPNRMVERNCTYFWYGLMQFSAPTNPHCYSLLHDFRIIKTHVPMTDYRSCMMLHV